jgi:hypothetical protein
MLQYTQLEGTPLMESLTALEDAILRTLLYADIFDFPLTEAELHHFLIGCAADLPTLRAVLRSSARLARYVEYCDGFWSLRGRAATVAVRRHREAASQLLLPQRTFTASSWRTCHSCAWSP